MNCQKNYGREDNRYAGDMAFSVVKISPRFVSNFSFLVRDRMKDLPRNRRFSNGNDKIDSFPYNGDLYDK